jgi:hypothetical protein
MLCSVNVVLSSIHMMPGLDLLTWVFALAIFVAGAAAAVLVVLGGLALRRSGEFGITQALWRGVLILVGSALVWTLLDRSAIRDEFAAERRSIDERAAELTARAIEPGSALACVDAVAGEAVELACENAVFASPEAVAAAVAYVDARISILSEIVKLAERDPSFRPSLERLRRPIESDRFGIVGHVLATRGCNESGCAELKLLSSKGRIVANMKAHAFEARAKAHAAGWQSAGAGIVAATIAPPSAPATAAVPALPQIETPPPNTAPATTMATVPSANNPSGFEYPSAASIPPVSIMNPEPEGPPAAAEPKAEPRAAPPPKRTSAPVSRRQSQREKATPPSAPLSVVPPAATPTMPQSSGSR